MGLVSGFFATILRRGFVPLLSFSGPLYRLGSFLCPFHPLYFFKDVQMFEIVDQDSA